MMEGQALSLYVCQAKYTDIKHQFKFVFEELLSARGTQESWDRTVFIPSFSSFCHTAELLFLGEYTKNSLEVNIKPITAR